MFYSFLVREEDRNFLWFKDKDLSGDVVDCRMRVHVFGNSPSPAVAIYGLHQSVQYNEMQDEPKVRDFVMHDFYVDDGLKSLPIVKAAVKLLKRTQMVLSKSNLRLQKIAANNKQVMDCFPAEDHASDPKDMDLNGSSSLCPSSSIPRPSSGWRRGARLCLDRPGHLQYTVGPDCIPLGAP